MITLSNTTSGVYAPFQARGEGVRDSREGVGSSDTHCRFSSLASVSLSLECSCVGHLTQDNGKATWPSGGMKIYRSPL